MKLIINNCEITVYENQSFDDLKRMIKEEKMIELGDKLSSYSASVIRIKNSFDNLTTSIIVHAYQFSPVFVAPNPIRNLILLGYNQEAFLYDLQNEKAPRALELDSLIISAQFIDEKVLIVCETDIYVFEILGREIYHVKLNDIIDYFSLMESEFTYTIGEREKSLNLERL